MGIVASGSSLTGQLAAARLATAKYATNLGRAKAAGYMVITPVMPNMGVHFLNPKIGGFDIRKPQILVYEKHGSKWQLGAPAPGTRRAARTRAGPPSWRLAASAAQRPPGGAGSWPASSNGSRSPGG